MSPDFEPDRHRAEPAHRKPFSPAGPPAGPSGAPESAGTVVLNRRYALLRRLGAGGEATVFLARDLLLDREVAVKLFRTKALDPSPSRLQAVEARVGAALNHYALTTLLDAGVGVGADGVPQVYLVMEYVPGESLLQRLKRGPLEVSDACWLGFELAEGLDYMHQSGFVHRDVKPANVLISELRSVRAVVAKITDFGISSPSALEQSSPFTLGTAAYISPEQVQGRPAIPQSDTYALGLLMLESMTGHIEFPGPVERSIFARLERDPVIPDAIPAPVRSLLSAMTARNPEDRLPLHEAAVELQQYLVDDLLNRRAPRRAQWRANDAPLAGETDQIDARAFVQTLEVATLVLRGRRAVLRVEAARNAADGSAAPSKAEWRLPGAVEQPVSSGPTDRSEVPTEHLLADRPVIGSRGQRFGTLAIFGDEARTLDRHDREVLASICALLGSEIEFRAAVRRAMFSNG